MARLDLTPFGFTPTESLVYQVLLTGGPGTGYAIARSAGLARANAYSALEGLVSKGAARLDAGRPRRYRPEPPAALHRPDLERPWPGARAAHRGSTGERPRAGRRPWSRSIGPRGPPARHARRGPRHRIGGAARAAGRLSAPGAGAAAAAFAARGPLLALAATGPVDLGFVPVDQWWPAAERWPGMPVFCWSTIGARSWARDRRRRSGPLEHGAAFVAGARLALERFSVA